MQRAMKPLSFAHVCLTLFSALFLLTETACSQAQLTHPLPLVSVSLDAQSILNQTSHQTIGTAKAVFEKAEGLAKRWSAVAEIIQVEGQLISANGLNDARGAQWIFSFSASDKPFKTYRVIARSENRRLHGLELQQNPMKKPLEVRAWVLDSSSVLNKARRLSERIPSPLPRLELSMSEDHRLVWQIPQLAPLPPLFLDAMNGQVID